MTESPPAADANRSPSTGSEKKLQQDRYRLFIEDVADGVYETNLQGNFLFFNDALCRIFGYARKHVHNRNFREFMDAETARTAYERFSEIFRSGCRATDILWEIQRQDGQTRILEISANLIFDKNGAKIGFRGIARDITEKHLAQLKAVESEKNAQSQYEASRRAELRYRGFLEFLPDPVFVFNPDGTVSYLNPAFEKVFGWSFKELEGKRIPFVPDGYEEDTRKGLQRLYKEKVINDFETKRLTKAGRLLDIVIDGALFYDENNAPAGQVITLRDVTQAKRAARSNQTLFRIAEAIHHYSGLDGLLAFITREIQNIMDVEGALVILVDEDRNEFFFRAAAYEDSSAEKKFRETRFPLDKGVAGQVYRTGQPLVVHDYYHSPYSHLEVDRQTGSKTRNMLQVPMWIEDRMIGVLCVVNKNEGQFEDSDIDFLSTIAGMVALPIENARINHELQNSYEEVKSLNRAKDRVIHHLSHELKTPVSVLASVLSILNRRFAGQTDQNLPRILERAQRNLDRILDMQYQIEDILREKDYKSYHMLTTLLDACSDELELLAAEETGREEVTTRLRRRIDKLFGPREAIPEIIHLDSFVEIKLKGMRSLFAHRRCRLTTRFEPTPAILIPSEVLAKIVEGLVRNAIENTPDLGSINISVCNRLAGPELEVSDRGVGITRENQRLIFESYFTTHDTLQYSSRKPYDFNAGGKGFDLLRMKIFSERYNFKIHTTSRRCGYIPSDQDICPGDIKRCEHCKTVEDCLRSGQTTIKVQFNPLNQRIKSPAKVAKQNGNEEKDA